MTNKRTNGFWILMIPGILILLMLIFGQMMSFINYEFTVSIGLQESVDVFGDFGVAMNKAFGVADTIIYLPLLVFGLLGLWKKRSWGVSALIGALAITAYWPLVYIFFVIYADGLPGFNFTDFTSFIIVLIVISAYGLWGFLYLNKNRKLFMD